MSYTSTETLDVTIQGCFEKQFKRYRRDFSANVESEMAKRAYHKSRGELRRWKSRRAQKKQKKKQ